MRSSLARLLGFAAAVLLSLTAARADFSGAFTLTSDETPPNYYGPNQGGGNVPTLGSWSASYLAPSGGDAFISTTNAPGLVTLYSYAGGAVSSETGLWITFTEDGYVSFDAEFFGNASGLYATSFNATLDGDVVAKLNWEDQGGFSTQDTFGFNVLTGQTLKFGSYSTGFDASASVYNVSNVSNFTFTPAAVPEPATFAAFTGLIALGLVASRRRARR